MLSFAKEETDKQVTIRNVMLSQSQMLLDQDSHQTTDLALAPVLCALKHLGILECLLHMF